MARMFKWEGDAAVAHLEDLELDALADAALAVVMVLEGAEGGPVSWSAPGDQGTPLGSVSGSVFAPDADAAADADDVDARFAALTEGLTLDLPDSLGQEPPAVDLMNRDSALARLLPTAHTSDPAAARDFAAMAHDGIRATKVANLRTLVAACERSRETGVMALDPVEARKVLAAFTDIRLVLADRLEIHEDGDAEAVERRTEELIAMAERGDRLTDSDEIVLQLGLHHGFVGWMQETLVEALLRH